MNEQIQTSLEYLACRCLEINEFQGYTDKDLFNATEIFAHVFLDVIYKENQHLNEEKQNELAEYSGKAIRELILTSTGKDMHKISKE